MSPSSRRAWIEIGNYSTDIDAYFVALLAEGVDRNGDYTSADGQNFRSPSSRRAWIEI